MFATHLEHGLGVCVCVSDGRGCSDVEELVVCGYHAVEEQRGDVIPVVLSSQWEVSLRSYLRLSALTQASVKSNFLTHV